MTASWSSVGNVGTSAKPRTRARWFTANGVVGGVGTVAPVAGGISRDRSCRRSSTSGRSRNQATRSPVSNGHCPLPSCSWAIGKGGLLESATNKVSVPVAGGSHSVPSSPRSTVSASCPPGSGAGNVTMLPNVAGLNHGPSQGAATPSSTGAGSRRIAITRPPSPSLIY